MVNKLIKKRFRPPPPLHICFILTVCSAWAALCLTGCRSKTPAKWVNLPKCGSTPKAQVPKHSAHSLCHISSSLCSPSDTAFSLTSPCAFITLCMQSDITLYRFLEQILQVDCSVSPLSTSLAQSTAADSASGALAHMDPHCQTTVSFCFSGARKWRMMLPPAQPHPEGYFDGQIYGVHDR